ncbi:MAG: GGDEF domain-containing protein [Gammaproteobacteria bacterium]
MKSDFSRTLATVATIGFCSSAQAADLTTIAVATGGFGSALVFLVAWLTTKSKFKAVRVKNIDLAGRLTLSEKSVSQLKKIRGEMTECLNMAKAETVAVEHRRREVSDMLAALRSQVERVARVDGLTGVANRQQFDISLTDEIKRCVRERKDVSLLIVELDSFVDFLDIHGEEKSEFALQRVASTISDSFRRAGDLVARISDYKFAVLLPGTNGETAVRFAEKMRKAIYAEALPFPASEVADRITVSVGVAVLPPVRLHRPENAIQIAEHALHVAQANGYNQVSSGEAETARNVV